MPCKVQIADIRYFFHRLPSAKVVKNLYAIKPNIVAKSLPHGAMVRFARWCGECIDVLTERPCRSRCCQAQ